MNKKVLKGIFAAVAFLTVLFAIVAYIITVPAEPADDILGHSLDAVILLCILSPILLIEFNIYRFFVYFLTEKKACWKTLFNIVMMILTLFFVLIVLRVFWDGFFNIWTIELKYIEWLCLIDGFVLVVLRFIYYLCCSFESHVNL